MSHQQFTPLPLLLTAPQYMVADLKRFEPRRQLREGLLWVVEQLPGMVEAADVTDVLARGHWPRHAVSISPACAWLLLANSTCTHMRARMCLPAL